MKKGLLIFHLYITKRYLPIQLVTLNSFFQHNFSFDLESFGEDRSKKMRCYLVEFSLIILNSIIMKSSLRYFSDLNLFLVLANLTNITLDFFLRGFTKNDFNLYDITYIWKLNFWKPALSVARFVIVRTGIFVFITQIFSDKCRI